ncbi:MAG: prolyl oligopeptidase family serine peptidase, partial [Muribaculaceae bacterium]|nr:prolyl oligopeptidase family serine peptidase [Muribaculaceae bacterium]
LYFYTNIDAPRYRVVAVDPARPERANWRTVVPETDDVLNGVSFTDGNKLILNYDHDAANRAFLADLNGKIIREIELPTYGSVGFSTDKDSDEVFYSFSSFTYPACNYAYNLHTGESTFLCRNEVPGLDPDAYVTEQVFYTSKDGTRVPMFIVYKKGISLDGTNPTLLYGYGGFAVTLNPGFNANRMLWLENGGIYAMANLRGGNEYGEDWHLAGTKLNKQNVFDDFISAAEYLVEKGYTSPSRLAIQGGSNGGLLIGATVNQRPDLFAVAIPQVGVMDMMRYHLFTIGWNWAPDYGTSDDSAEMAEYLLGYSPVHNIRNDGTPYPAILVTTADHDDRVVPAHSFKYAATLQASDTGDKPKLIRIDSKAGHGAGKPIAKIIDEQADIYSFIFQNLGVNPTEK